MDKVIGGERERVVSQPDRIVRPQEYGDLCVSNATVRVRWGPRGLVLWVCPPSTPSGFSELLDDG